ncbi:MAG: anaerobic sulfatase maturase [Phycisphaera sp.]|nr:anaerobic sulfatase maturase [Phycisphaera sp.]
MTALPVLSPSQVTLMIKPVGALCNLDCTYCYYLPTKTVYDGHEHKMSLATLESVFAGFLPGAADEVTFAWQGGEPTLAGLDFFKKAIEFQEKYKRPSQKISNALQTNGTLLDDDWCAFLHKHEFLIGLSMDGGKAFHNYYRKTNSGGGSYDQVMRGLKYLRKHKVEHNVLCVLNNHNVKHPRQLWDFMLNVGVKWLQFIPCIEWEKDPETGQNKLAPYSPDPHDYGKFLCEVFDIWFARYRGDISVRIFDAVLNKLVLNMMPFCILNGSCHGQMTIEHNGDVYGCDHFVERRWQLSKIGDETFRNPIHLDGSQEAGLTIHGSGYRKNAELEGRDIQAAQDLDERYKPKSRSTTLDPDWLKRSEGQRLGAFAKRKQDLPQKCFDCQWKPFCHGGCPKHRAHGGDVPEPTVLCESYIMFYNHAMLRMQWLAEYLRMGVQPPPPGEEPVPMQRR